MEITQNRNYMTLEIPRTKATLWLIPLGRFVYSLLFIMSSFNHFDGQMISYAANHGVPLAGIMVPVSGILALLGGLSILLGYKTHIGATLLIIFLIPVTLMMHNFWAIADAQEAQNQMIHFMKNISMLGGAIFFLGMGPGPISLDQKNHRYP
jgi:putative oxidoreductase